MTWRNKSKKLLWSLRPSLEVHVIQMYMKDQEVISFRSIRFGGRILLYLREVVIMKLATLCVPMFRVRVRTYERCQEFNLLILVWLRLHEIEGEAFHHLEAWERQKYTVAWPMNHAAA